MTSAQRVSARRVGVAIEFLPVGTVLLSECGPVLRSGEIAAALALSGGRLRRPYRSERTAAQMAALVLRGVDRAGGVARLRRLTESAHAALAAEVDGRATPAQLRTVRALWGSDSRRQLCVGVTFWLVNAIEDGVLDLPRPHLSATARDAA